MQMTNIKEAVYVALHKGEISGEYHEGTLSDEVFLETDTYSLDDTAVILKEKGKDFKLLNLTDVHFSDYGYRMFLNPEHELLMRRLIETEKPDMIMLTGDIVCGDSCVGHTESRAVMRIEWELDGVLIPRDRIIG